ncbi:hypothetical protein [Burkholderia sp. SCN-KJ]|uniref:hypothetical protein n=1 Tax=Burkholderia sp. SCN-KJ TaxID=2969248 RepID=UPI00214FB83A|nr:hypothetical protein [Burkholderia sp. SCN-KJ]MCR4471267.1 hypothetical protein [Burkholderia sp. SCN-KJ]
MMASILTFAYIKQILLYAFKFLFIDDSRISSDKSAPAGRLEYFVTSNPTCATSCASHHQCHRFLQHAILPPADRDTCPVVDRTKRIPPLKRDFVPVVAGPVRDIHRSPAGRVRSSAPWTMRVAAPERRPVAHAATHDSEISALPTSKENESLCA